MEGEKVPYREPGVRPKLTDEERRWFTKQGDREMGPYALDALVRSVKSGMLKQSALVRAEDETEWRPLRTVDAVTEAIRGPSPGWTKDVGAEAPVPEMFTGGSFGSGFAAGFVGGLVGWILVLALAKGYETKRGASAGFALQFLLGVVINVAMCASQNG